MTNLKGYTEIKSRRNYFYSEIASEFSQINMRVTQLFKFELHSKSLFKTYPKWKICHYFHDVSNPQKNRF